MVSQPIQPLGLTLGIFGFMGTIIISVLPMWRVTTFSGEAILVPQIWKGPWVTCMMELKVDQMQCNYNYFPLMDLPLDLLIARILVVIAITMCVFAIILAIAGSQCNLVEDELSKTKVALAIGVTFVISGVLVFIPVYLTTVYKDFYNPDEHVQRSEGPAIHIGKATGALLLLGGSLICCYCLTARARFICCYLQNNTASKCV